MTELERQQFLLFLQSPYFTGRRDVSVESFLVQYLFVVITEPESLSAEALQREYIYQLIFPGETFNARNMTQIIGNTLKLLRAFVEIEMLQRSTNTVGQYGRLIDFFTKKGATNPAIRYSTRLKREQENKNSTDVLDFWEAWQAESAKSRFVSTLNDLRGDMNIQKAMETLETFYWIQRLDFLIALFNLKNFNTVLTQETIDGLVQEIEQAASKPWSSTPLGQLYLAAVRLLYSPKDQKEAIFYTFFEQFAGWREQVSAYHSERFETILSNFCIQQLHENKYSTYLLRLYEDRFKPQIAGGQSSIWCLEFLSIVKLGLVLENLDFVQKFVEMARHKIVGIQPSEEYYLFAKASCLFAEGNYKEARAIISRLDFQDNLYRFFSKILEIKILYEGGKSDATSLDTHLNAFRMLVKRESNLSNDKEKGYETFYKYVSRLARYRNTPQKFVQRLHELEVSLDAEQNIYDLLWIRKKTQDILNAAANAGATAE